jgi:hypothetical protein
MQPEEKKGFCIRRAVGGWVQDLPRTSTVQSANYYTMGPTKQIVCILLIYLLICKLLNPLFIIN